MFKPVALLLLGLALATSPAAGQRLKVSVPLNKLEAAARADSNDATAHYNLALGYWSKERWDDAERALEQCLQLEPRYALAHLALAHLPFARRPRLWKEVQEDEVPTSELPALQRSERDYRRAFFFDPLVELRIIGAVVPPKSWVWAADPSLSAMYDTWLRAFEDFRDADYESAFRRFEEMAERYTATGMRQLKRIPADVLWYQGLTAAHLGKYQIAIENVREVLRRTEDEDSKREEELSYNPLRANEYRYVLGVLMIRGGQGALGREELKRAAAEDMGLYMAHVNIAASLEQDNRWYEAVAARRAALAANPEDPSSAIELALTLARSGGGAEVESTLAEVARTNPRNARAYYLLGLTRQQLGMGAEAKAAFEHFIRIAPSHGEREVEDARRRLAEL